MHKSAIEVFFLIYLRHKINFVAIRYFNLPPPLLHRIAVAEAQQFIKLDKHAPGPGQEVSI